MATRKLKAETETEPTPTTTEPEGDAAMALGFRAGTKTHAAALLYLRPEGASMREIIAECGGPHRNLLKRVQEKGHTVHRTTVDGGNGKAVTSYRIELLAEAE